MTPFAFILMRDRLGRLSEVADSLGGPRLIEHNLFGSLEREESAFGPELELGYDSHNRLDSISVMPSGGGSPLTGYSFGYEPGTSRISQIDYEDHAISYGYHANSALIETVAFEQDGALRLTTTHQYDNLNRLRAISSGSMSYTYSYNAANQRVAAELADGSKWSFAYDDRGQLTAGERRWVDGIPVDGQQFGYGFDDIGNRQFAVRNGRTAAYQADLINRIEEREVPGALEILGHAHPEAIVTVNQQNVTRQREGYFHHSLSVDNAGQDVWEEVNIVGVRNGEGPNGEDVVSEVSGHAFVPADPELLQYDDDGNILQDSQWNYTWNAENRLIRIETRSDLHSSVPRKRIDFAYDWQGRRAVKETYRWEVSSYVPEQTIQFIYHGWNLLTEIDADSGNLIRSYAWGLDLSGSLQGAGGVGGLLAIRDHAENAIYYPVYDGNGSVTGLIDSIDASVAAIYEYGPFGEEIRATAPSAAMNPFRFSTKYFDAETELYYYGYRYYSPSMGRFFNRDPIEEQGGLNLYGFVRNDPVNRWDYLGLQASDLPVNTLRQIIGRIEAHLMVGNRHDAAREAWRLYNHISTYGGLLGDKPFAADMMKHWLGNTGNLKTVARKYVKGLVQDPQVTQDFGVSIGDVVSDGGNGNVKHSSGVTPVHNSDNYYAVGSFNLTFEGKYCRAGNEIRLDGKWDISDDYDWHEGLSVTILGVVVPDSYGLLVEEHKFARPYPVEGTWTGEHTVCSDGVIPENVGR